PAVRQAREGHRAIGSRGDGCRRRGAEACEGRNRLRYPESLEGDVCHLTPSLARYVRQLRVRRREAELQSALGQVLVLARVGARCLDVLPDVRVTGAARTVAGQVAVSRLGD